MGYLADRLQKPVTQNTEHNTDSVNRIANGFMVDNQRDIELALHNGLITPEEYTIRCNALKLINGKLEAWS